MKKIIFLLFAVTCFKNIFCQDVIINGSSKYRLLTWDDFSGKPDKNSPYQANTYWGLNYSFKGVDFTGDTIKLKGFSATLMFNENKSWVKKGTQTAGLLKHEQGHFDIGLICQKEFISTINNTVFFKAGLNEKVQSIFTTIMKKYHTMQLKYDEETDHSKNRQNQEKWDEVIAKSLQQQ
jgi:Bacterial protein of unknown function (DUF922)